MTDQQTVEHIAPPRVPGAGSPRRSHGDGSHARNMSPGFVAKLVLVGTVDALGVYGILAALAVRSWTILAFLVVALLVVNWVYFSRRAVPGKYLVPGLLFLLVYQLFVMATDVTDDDVECFEGRRIVFVDPATIGDLPLTRAAAQSLPVFLASETYARMRP